VPAPRAPDALGGGGCLGVVTAGKRYFIALFREGQAGLKADARVAAGDDNTFAGGRGDGHGARAAVEG
jgi:hypothetical protein